MKINVGAMAGGGAQLRTIQGEEDRGQGAETERIKSKGAQRHREREERHC